MPSNFNQLRFGRNYFQVLIANCGFAYIKRILVDLVELNPLLT